MTTRAAKASTASDQREATATDLADYLVKKGVPFRDAHEVVARVVRHAEARHVDISELSLTELRGFSSKIAPDVKRALTLEGSVAARKHTGGTAPERVRAAAQRILRQTQ